MTRQLSYAAAALIALVSLVTFVTLTTLVGRGPPPAAIAALDARAEVP